ncbi:MAG: cysteine--tRNA ligase [bacterium]|nr:cysteine--tRNA ligase [bacterium]
MLKIYNTGSNKKEKFVPMKKGKVGMYTCGMTVYDFAHIGHGRKYVGDDILRRILEWSGYDVKHVQNVTDVGHLSSDEDEGEDKMEKGAIKFGKTVWDVAEFFTDHFFTSMDALNIERPHIICKATDHIPEQIGLVQTLIKKGFAYDTPEAVYFDIDSFKAYGRLFRQKLDDKKTAVRAEVQTGEYKKNPHDFALWFKRVGHFSNHTMYWASPWGDGFPGWHIECSAMSMKYLGETFDIHTGGIDHIPVHHTNEIAQSEAATGKPLAHFWVHHAFLTVNGIKMAKSLGNFITIEEIIKKGYDPLELRFFYLSAHYRQQLNFTWEALDGAKAGYKNLCNLVQTIREKKQDAVIRSKISTHLSDLLTSVTQQFSDAVSDDMNMPKAMAVFFDFLKRVKTEKDLSARDYLAIYDEILRFDTVFGLRVNRPDLKTFEVPSDIQILANEREKARKSKKWAESDRLRDEITSRGFVVEDTANGSTIRPV